MSNFPELTEEIEQEPVVSDVEDGDSLIREKNLSIISRFRSDTKHRIWLAWAVIGIIFLWLVFIAQLLCLNNKVYHISDAVLMAVLGSSTVTVIGLAVIVLKGFFQYMDQTTKLFD